MKMTEQTPSQEAFHKHFSSIEKSKELVFEMIKKMNRPVSAFDIMDEFVKDNPLSPGKELHRLVQSVHGACSTLVKEGRVIRPGFGTNPDTKSRVYLHTVAPVGTLAQETVSKGYKEKYELLLEKMKELSEQNETLIMINQQLRDKLALVAA
jgi:hypothetical protein